MRGLIAHSKAAKECVSRAVYFRFYTKKVKDKQKKQVTHTYNLILAKRFMEATKLNKEKMDIIR